MTDRPLFAGQIAGAASEPAPRPAATPAAASVPAPTPEFDALYRRHFSFVYRSVARMGVASYLVDDAVQDVFLVVLRQLDRLRPNSNERAWLFAIATRVSSDYRRTARRKTPWVPLESAPPPADARDPQRRAEVAEAGRWLQEFLEELDEGRRDVFILMELEQLSAPEASEILGVNVNTVYTRLRSARSHLTQRARRVGTPGATGGGGVHG